MQKIGYYGLDTVMQISVNCQDWHVELLAAAGLEYDGLWLQARKIGGQPTVLDCFPAPGQPVHAQNPKAVHVTTPDQTCTFAFRTQPPLGEYEFWVIVVDSQGAVHVAAKQLGEHRFLVHNGDTAPSGWTPGP